MSGPQQPPDPGPPGLSAYQIARRHGFVGTEEQWLASLRGGDGEDGDDGKDADPAVIERMVAAAVAAIPKPKDGENGKSVDVEQVRQMVKAAVDAIPRPANGKDGEDGKRGQRGFSAYQVAKQLGFEGTQAEWLKTLQGPPGEVGPIPQPQWRGTELRWLDPRTGEPISQWVDLRGPAVKGRGTTGGIDVNALRAFIDEAIEDALADEDINDTPVPFSFVAPGENLIYEPAEGKRIRLYRIRALNDPDAVDSIEMRLMLGDVELQRGYVIEYRPSNALRDGAVDAPLKLILGASGSVSGTAYIEELTPT